VDFIVSTVVVMQLADDGSIAAAEVSDRTRPRDMQMSAR
jgi:hypothetical protein